MAATIEDTKQAGRRLLLAQAVYYLVTGLWPLLHTRSFLAVTGPKTDIWLLKTLSLLIAAVGASLLHSSLRGNLTPEARSLACGTALVLACDDVYYVARGTISPVYLLDAATEAPLAIVWAAGLGDASRAHGPKATSMSTSASDGSRPKKLATSSS